MSISGGCRRGLTTPKTNTLGSSLAPSDAANVGGFARMNRRAKTFAKELGLMAEEQHAVLPRHDGCSVRSGDEAGVLERGEKEHGSLGTDASRLGAERHPPK